ncbi:hypothetical protein [uncultured Clostridium sp.]|uniref:hypothetical protein n=1 Tax=uncultured Clostridium sp. TaxID=59620 RepID=UPI0028EC38BD|nr:hypothetical protein [uncultured Clostridium sp.]
MFFIICGVTVPIVFVIYNIVCYSKKKVIYTMKDKNLVIINDKFFKIQLCLSCVNSIFIAIIVYMWDKVSYRFKLLLLLLTFWGINYLIKFIAILKEYEKKESK